MKPMTNAPRDARVETARVARSTRVAVAGETLRELFAMLGATTRWWLAPIVVVMLGAAVLLVLVQAVEYVAPFVYTVF